MNPRAPHAMNPKAPHVRNHRVPIVRNLRGLRVERSEGISRQEPETSSYEEFQSSPCEGPESSQIEESESCPCEESPVKATLRGASPIFPFSLQRRASSSLPRSKTDFERNFMRRSTAKDYQVCDRAAHITQPIIQNSLTTVAPPILLYNEAAGFETNSLPCLLTYGALCHPDVMVR